MPQIEAALEYLQKLQLYEREKPYWCFLPPSEGYDPNVDRVDNLEFEEHGNILIRDLRECEDPAPHIDDWGFQFLSHRSAFGSFNKAEDVARYRVETEELLKTTMNAVYVNCYDSVLRKNIVFKRDHLDLADPLHTEGPARGVHNDITYKSGPLVINRFMSDAEKARFLRPGYRIRIINTWRTLIPVLKDRPLAFCDSRSVDPSDLVAADRIIPENVGEVYYLTYNPKHQWYWLEEQTPEEPLIFVMYDTKDGPHGRFCPHVSFKNPRCPEDAPPRESIETRSIVITKDG
ncbi:hypothetical protein ONS95_007434 [Cadophora gregata]|uniref:uncharacterized protein n=1 Tax=Cadophora gregata TaxID=51156 RepID=UPI0026DD3FB5|nr:uncharacterized protein ONS95_007434 [Cadophora gregata]KAK0118546.1 hypothetical protein ONS96_011640 [Cadophora gregata f. sp. sojae]KAK0125802.1 hypothetical protein ONS95_007434 [Cadophora gregata]